MKFRTFTLISFLTITGCKWDNKLVYYTVTWKNYNGEILEIDENVPEGEMPSFDGETPLKESDEDYKYIFKSWDKELTFVNSDITYTATFDTFVKDGHIVASHKSGFYDQSFKLTLRAPEGFEIYYTTDNSDPTSLSTKYTSPIEIKDKSNEPNYYSLIDNISPLDVYYPTELVDKCQIIKVIAINPTNNESTEIFNFNYFINFQNKTGYDDMLVVTLNVNDDDLFDYEKGIYTLGKIYDESEHTGYPETYPANYNQKGKEWERPAMFRFFDKDKNLYLEQKIGIRTHGGWSRAFNQKSFNLYAKKDYDGTSTFKKPFFENINPHSLMLRSGGYRDTDITKVRDSLNQDLSANEKFSIQRSFPVILFLNGEYWGIYNLQERFCEQYVEEHYGINKKNVLIIKNDELDDGKEEDVHFYNEFKTFFSENEFSSSEMYEQAKQYIDVEEFASYMATQLYVGNIDWPGNNVRVFKDVKSSNSKWHFMMYDTDDSSDIISKCAVDSDPFTKATHWKSGPLEDDCVLGLLLSKLIENPTFRALFRQTFIRIGQNNFSPTNVSNYLTKKSALLSKPMVKNYKRFVNNDLDQTYFNENISKIQSFFNNRYGYAIEYLNLHIPEVI